jgi:ribosome-binding protein aMBF1 (putative translation factor)
MTELTRPTISSFDAYLQEQLRDPDFRRRFEAADCALDVALRLADLRRQRGLTQAQVAEMLGTKQQNISRLENPAYRGHTLSMLSRYARVLGGELRVTVAPQAQAQARPVGVPH